MSQPTPYSRSFSFTSYQQSNPSTPLPGNRVDIEYNNVKVTLDEVLANLQQIQRDDGALQNGIVTQASLADELSIGFTFRGAWAQGVSYLVADGVALDGKFYVCTTAHTSSVTNSPALAPSLWDLAVDFTTIALNATGSMTPFAFSGDGSTTVFTLPASVSNSNNLAVFVAGSYKRPSADYTASGTTLTMASAPASGTNNLTGYIFNVVSVVAGLPASSVTVSPTVSGGSDAQTVLTTHASLISAAQSAANMAQTTANTAVTNAATAQAAADAAQADADAAYTVATTGNVSGTRITSGTLPFSAVDSAAVASQAEAEAGTSALKLMTPERTAQAIASLASAGATAGRLLGVTYFTTSGTWTKSTLNPGFVIVEVVGGGGSGARASSNPFCNGGAAGGYSTKRIIAPYLSSTETVTVAAGGAAQSNNNTNGSVGGTSSFGVHCSASGGGAGVTGTSAQTSPSGGVGYDGLMNARGNGGGLGLQANIPGYGGIGFFGGGGRQPHASTVVYSGEANSGAGGSGCFNAISGAGGSGIVIVWEYA